MNAHPSRSESEMFAIARERAADDAQRRGVLALLAQLKALGDDEEALVHRIRGNRRARGEALPSLTSSANMVRELGGDPGLEPLIATHLRGLADAREVLKGVAHGHRLFLALRRRNLQYHAAEDRPLEQDMLARWTGFIAALTEFIADPDWAREVAHDVARQQLSAGGGAVHAVVEGSDDVADMDGKALSKHFERMERLAGEAGHAPLGDFFGFGEQADAGWFDPAPALATVAALDAAIVDIRLHDKPALQADLQALAGVLQAAAGAGRRFHLEVDV